MCVSNQHYPILYVFTCRLKKSSQTGENSSNVTFFHPDQKGGSSGHEFPWDDVIEALSLHLQEGVAQCSWGRQQADHCHQHPKIVTQRGKSSTATCSMWQHWHQAHLLNRALQLETCRKGSPNKTEPEGSVRIQKNTKEHCRTDRGQIRMREKALPRMHKLLYTHESFSQVSARGWHKPLCYRYIWASAPHCS